MPQFKYKAIRVRQTESGDQLVLFAAPATEIDLWVGVPQKQEIDQEETTGFQREEDKKRIRELKSFYKNERNIIQNALLCARRETSVGKVTFEVAGDSSQSADVENGFLSIEVQDLESLSLLEILRLVKKSLEDRLDTLAQAKVPDELIYKIKSKLTDEYHITQDADKDEANDDEIGDESLENEDEEATSEDAASVLLDESHILEFWQRVAARVRVLEDLDREYKPNELAGFTKEAMIAYLRPVVLVDGQHRLRGAIEAAKDLADSDDKYQSEIEDRLAKGEIDDVVQAEIEARIARRLPISLLMSSDPAEQVFQFVVVNQKAVPLGKALLGTIVSTTLSNEELERVSERLTDAGIKLEQSRVVAFLSRSPDSPFVNLVEKGTTKNGDLLPWTVMMSLATMFQKLRGGKLFGEKNDYAAIWQSRYLPDSAIVADWEDKGFKSPLDYWSAPNGVWREVFIRFWAAVRDELSNTTNPKAKNYWGAARESQIFNKISLTILAADFFQFLCDTRTKLNDFDDIARIVKEEWLEQEFDRTYFASDWKLSGIKKDSTGISKKWAELWKQYRKNPVRLPSISEYRKPSN